MVLHVMSGISTSVYMKKYCDFITKNFSVSDHVFATTDRIPAGALPHDKILIFNLSSSTDSQNLLTLSLQAQRIIIHSLFSMEYMNWLVNNRALLRKSIWIAWGGDLYNFWTKDKYSSLELLHEFFKTEIIKDIMGVASLVKEDYVYVTEKYQTKARYYYAFYPNPVDFFLLDHAGDHAKEPSRERILVGNSATWTNNHFDVLEAISKVGKASFQILCPLSYGDPEYAKKVIEFGRKLFGDRFIPLTQFLSPEEYAKVLASVDVGIFNHNRQQGLGNILALLYLGKKVYIRDDVTAWKFFERYGIKVYNTKELISNPDSSMFDFDESIGRKNREIVAREFSEERAVELWKKVFYE